METAPHVLIADDEQNLRRVLEAMLRRAGFRTHTVADGQAAWEALSGDVEYAVLVTDLRMPRMDGMELLRRVAAEREDLPVVMITAHGSVNSAVEAVKLGAFDYIEKPFEDKVIRQVVTKAAAHYRAARRHARAADSPGRGRFGLIGTGPAMQEVFAIIERVADTPTTVLITGESGTGKELVAKALHQQSSRKDRPFIKINCAAIPETLIESELFGYEKGAFTGADASKPGRFELADGGTLLLDEVGEIPGPMQVKLLRALQESEFERVGGIKTVRVDVRMVAATNRDLARATEEGTFREDLFYRLNVVPIRLPPLRERQEDIPLLVEHFLRRYNAKLGKHVRAVSPAAMERLRAHPWPGNIRELENLLERTVLFCDADVIELRDLPPEVLGGGEPFAASLARPAAPVEGSARSGVGTHGVAREVVGGGGSTVSGAGQPAEAASEVSSAPLAGSLKEAVKAETVRVEREMIVRALEETGGNVTRAARLLQISRKSLQIKMKDLGLRRGEEAPPTAGSD